MTVVGETQTMATSASDPESDSAKAPPRWARQDS